MNPVEQRIAEVLPDVFGAPAGARESVGCDVVIPEGRRNAHLASLAGAMRHRGMTPEAMAAALLEENARRCSPPLPENEVRAIAASVGKYEPSASVVRCLDAMSLADATLVAAEGRAIARDGVKYLVDGLIPDYGVAGFSVAYTKVGKTTWAQQLGGAVATGADFLGRSTRKARVLVVAAEDPPEYTAWLARHLAVPEGVMTFYRAPVRLDADGLSAIATTIAVGGYGLVLIASWQAVVAGLIRDENDNAGSVVIVERVKAVARETSIPWLVDAHSGKAEDQSEDADPTRALRGASAAAGSADFVLSLRYANGAFGTQRRLSGKGRFVSFAPITMDFDPSTGTYTVLSEAKSAQQETTWRLISEAGALTAEPRTAGDIARAIGLVDAHGRPTKTHKRQVGKALAGRSNVLKFEIPAPGGKKTTAWSLHPMEQ